MAKPVLMAWSGGKDSALALREILADARYRAAALLTTVTGEYDRVSMHGVRRTLLRRQAVSLGLPLEEVVISPGASNDEYEGKMGAALEALRTRVPGLDAQLAGEFAGREFDAALLHDLPPNVDPCGENGEFHTFVYAGPGLRQPVRHARGPVVLRDGRFVYCELVDTVSP